MWGVDLFIKAKKCEQQIYVFEENKVRHHYETKHVEKYKNLTAAER